MSARRFPWWCVLGAVGVAAACRMSSGQSLLVQPRQDNALQADTVRGPVIQSQGTAIEVMQNGIVRTAPYGSLEWTTEEWELEQQTQSLIEQHRQQTDAAARTETQKSLSAVLTKAFEHRQARRKKELEDLQARVAELQELLDKREQAKAEIVQNRLDALLRDADGLGWGESSIGPSGLTTSRNALNPPWPARLLNRPSGAGDLGP